MRGWVVGMISGGGGRGGGGFDGVEETTLDRESSVVIDAENQVRAV